MKKVKFEKKLSFKKQTVANLNKTQLNNLIGGNQPTISRPVSNCGDC